MIDIHKLQYLAEAQPVKEWKSYYRDHSMYEKKPMYAVRGPGGVSDHEDWGFTRAAASYIAAACPAVLLELIAELNTLRSQVAALQADPNSWQSGYDEGRKMGTKTALSEREQLKTENEVLRKDAARLDWLGGTFGGIDIVRDQIDAAMKWEQQ